MNAQQVIAALGALAHAHRLAVYRLLVMSGPGGLNAGTIGESVGLVPSSLTFHLQNLQRAGLITQRREGRQLIYSADFGAMSTLVGYLTENCCRGVTQCTPSAPPAAAKSRRARTVA